MTIYEWVFFDREQYDFRTFIGTKKDKVNFDAYLYYCTRFAQYAADEQFRGDGDFEANNLSLYDFCRGRRGYMNCADYGGLEWDYFEHTIKEEQK